MSYGLEFCQRKLEQDIIKILINFVRLIYVEIVIGRIIENKRKDLTKELARLTELEEECKRCEKDFYCRVILGNCFDKTYYEKVKNRKIIADIKAELPSVTNSQIKRSIIKIFQFQELNFNLRGKSYKKRLFFR